ncbi:MAG: DUF4430 domain-containing protein [Oscillospiraceae bacterium]|nr:DUF4430 domain-containing protein [Oscillospiraceae bacterium]
MKRALSILLVLACVLLFAACGAKKPVVDNNSTTTVLNTEDYFLPKTDLGQGKTEFKLLVTTLSGTIQYNVHTNEATVGAALKALGFVAYDESGLIISVNQVTADYSKDGAYWAFYVGGAYANQGPDETTIDPKKDYMLVYTRAE